MGKFLKIALVAIIAALVLSSCSGAIEHFVREKSVPMWTEYEWATEPAQLLETIFG